MGLLKTILGHKEHEKGDFDINVVPLRLKKLPKEKIETVNENTKEVKKGPIGLTQTEMHYYEEIKSLSKKIGKSKMKENILNIKLPNNAGITQKRLLELANFFILNDN